MFCCNGVGIANTSAEAASGNSIDTVKQLIKGDQSLENVKIGESIKDVLTKYKNPMYSYNEDGTEHYYEFHTKKGMLLVTTDGKKNNGKVTHISMMYNDANGPTYQAVKNYVGKAVTIRNIAKLLVILDILEKGKTTYQFASAPKDKNIKLYRIDLEK
ncbi:exported protein [Staphylococcus aureus]|uniref:Exported protein n=1 Tax=Staphylococcus aureus TaxID=1280 RepID=A0A380DLH1_STAAU|nr:exported protein [Staphylococcus aureus]